MGAEFKIYLPRIVDRTASPKSHPKKITFMPKGGETILVVEDEEHVRELTKRVLESCGYVVWKRATASRRWISRCSTKLQIHLLISDVVMPQGMDGPQVAGALLPQHPEMKVLYVSGFANNSIPPNGSRSDGDSYSFLQKPYTPAALTQKVREVLDEMD